MAKIVFSEGSGLNDSVYGKCQQPIKMFIEKRGEAFEAKSVLPEIFNMQKSTHFGEKIASMTAMDGFKPVGEGGNYPVDGIISEYNDIAYGKSLGATAHHERRMLAFKWTDELKETTFRGVKLNTTRTGKVTINAQ